MTFKCTCSWEYTTAGLNSGFGTVMICPDISVLGGVQQRLGVMGIVVVLDDSVEDRQIGRRDVVMVQFKIQRLRDQGGQ